MPGTDKTAAAEGYDVGFQSAGKSYWEKNNDLLEEAYQRISGLESASAGSAVVPVGQGLGALDAIDPTTTQTPVNDAIDAVYDTGRGGHVWLPMGDIKQNDSIRPKPGVSIYGPGRSPHIGPPTSQVEITDPDSHLIYFDSSENQTYSGIELDGFHVMGQGADTHTGNALQFGDPNKSKTNNQQAYGFHLGKLFFRRFQGSLIRVEQGGEPWACDLGYINAYGFDPGGTANSAVLDFTNALSVATHIGMIDAYPGASVSGTRSDFMRVSAAGDLRVDFLNIGGTINRVLVQDDGGGAIDIAGVNYEITTQLDAARESLYTLADNSLVRIGQTRMHSDVTNLASIYRLEDGGQSGAPGAANKEMGPVVPTGQLSLPSPIVDVRTDTSGSCTYHGVSGEVANNSGGALSPGVACLGDLTMVT